MTTLSTITKQLQDVTRAFKYLKAVLKLDHAVCLNLQALYKSNLQGCLYGQHKLLVFTEHGRVWLLIHFLLGKGQLFSVPTLTLPQIILRH